MPRWDPTDASPSTGEADSTAGDTPGPRTGRREHRKMSGVFPRGHLTKQPLSHQA